MNKKVALHTLGCKLNFSETSTIGNQFMQKGFRIVDVKQEADVYVFNTCTVTENADRECRQLVRRALRKNPSAYIIVTGCYAQLRSEEIAGIKGVDLILGSKEKFNLFQMIDDFNKNDFACIFVSPTVDLTDFGEAHSTEADSRTRAYFKIQDGCNYKCSFCTIPLARGRSRSMDYENAIIEFTNLVNDGYKEIILTGVNVGDYGNSSDTNLYKLLKDLVKVEGDFRIRVSSIEPNLLTDDIITLIAEEEKLCNHLHIPLQSGSPDILRAMQRRYKINDYDRVIQNASSRIKDVGIGVDVIVGFPGESDEDFWQTYNFIKDLPVSYLHVFTYSERPDTLAIKLPDKLDVSERKHRNKILRNLSEKKRLLFYQKMTGTEFKVLFEHENLNGKMHGFTSNYIKVTTDFNQDLVNRLTKVRLTGIDEKGLCKCSVEDINNSVDLVQSLK